MDDKTKFILAKKLTCSYLSQKLKNKDLSSEDIPMFECYEKILRMLEQEKFAVFLKKDEAKKFLSKFNLDTF